MFTISRLTAQEILDSRGRPTVRACCRLHDGATGCASVPSGASTGRAEALELRDNDPTRYRGLGCRRAVAHIENTIHNAVAGRSFASQQELDEALIILDGTPNKGALGANAILAVSLAYARAVASSQNIPLYRYFASVAATEPTRLPRPTINLFSGGRHAGGQCAVQDVLVVPASARTVDEVLAMTYAIYQCAAELISTKYGMRMLRADEGGLAPPFPCAEAMLEDAICAIEKAGLKPGADVSLAVDVAATHFYEAGRYRLDERSLDSTDMIEQLVNWTKQYPIVSVEDGLAEDDWMHWPGLANELRGRCRVVGDDLLCTHPDRIGRAAEAGAADTLLLKVNQIGCVSEAWAAAHLARRHGWQITVSARSGETEDDWLADLAVGWNADQIKVGSITQSERLSKYNRLLIIERETAMPLVSWPNEKSTGPTR